MKAKPDKPKSGRIRLDNEAIILAAAEHEFTERGHGGASMDRIATGAGIARTNPKASKHYASEIIHDAPNLTAYLSARRAGRTILRR